ncbi:Gfo/Idh/MocA family oxidoreductase [candidate division KSB1 bacterium]|nr:Gfo/Idh/MocA family oxidoreductase [candidate division KSB1 bacterium]
MKTRRAFIKDAGTAALYTAMASAGLSNAKLPEQDRTDKKNIRIGIIGAENSHTAGLGRLFNVEKKYPGIEVLYVWGETDEFAKNSAEKGAIPNIVKDPAEMMGKIDALIVDHRHAKYHLKAALPFVKVGIPTFVDKPFCYRVEEGKEFFKIARELGTPVTSFSSIAQSEATFDMKAQIPSTGNIEHILWYGPADIASKYGGIFFYGVHIVQPLMVVFGEDIEAVKVTRHGNHATAGVVFSSGYYATLIFTKARERSVVLLTDAGEKRLESRVQESNPPKHYQDMVELFRTGKEPRSHQSILNCVAVLEALEKSVKSQKWEYIKI